MGTTFVACALRFDSAVISHVGDSRCYLFRNGNGTLLTRDHTMAAGGAGEAGHSRQGRGFDARPVAMC